MANAIYTGTKFHILTTSDIVFTTPMCVSKLQMRATAAADEAHFYTLVAGTAADHDNHLTNLTFDANTYTITDADTGDNWTDIAANDWVHITECSIAANNGWWYLKADGGNSTFDIDHTSVVKGTTRVLTAGTSASARIRTYTPTECAMIVADTDGGSGTPIHHPIVDFGERGRWFTNLSFQTADTLEVHLYEK